MKKKIASVVRGYAHQKTIAVVVILMVTFGLIALTISRAESPYTTGLATSGTLGGSATTGSGSAVQFGSACTIPTVYPAAPNGGMAYVNWYFDSSTPLTSIWDTVDIYNNPGTSSDLYLQLYDGSIDGTAQYYGLQTNGLAIFSEFGTSDTSDVSPASGASVVTGTEGSPYVSLRYSFGSLPAGIYQVKVEEGAYNGSTGDWFNYYVTPPGGAQTYIGALLFPRANPSVPASFKDGGGTWTEDYENNGTTLYPVPLWHISVAATANDGSLTPDSALSAYSAMPNSDEYAESPGGTVDQVIGGSTPRCHSAGWLWYQINTSK